MPIISINEFIRFLTCEDVTSVNCLNSIFKEVLKVGGGCLIGEPTEGRSKSVVACWHPNIYFLFLPTTPHLQRKLTFNLDDYGEKV